MRLRLFDRQRGDCVWNAATGEFANEGKLLSDGETSEPIQKQRSLTAVNRQISAGLFFSIRCYRPPTSRKSI